MRRAIRLAMRLYPAAWRERYGREFEALLEDVQPGGRELWDVAAGAMKMQMMTWSWRKTAAAFALAGAVVAGVVALRTPDTYISTAVMRVKGAEDEARLADRLQQAETQVLSRTSLAQVVMRNDLYQDERKRLPLEDVIQDMRNREIRVVPVSEPGSSSLAFSLSFRNPDREAAQRVTRELTNQMVEATKSDRSPLTLEVLDPATLPERATSPNRAALVGAGLAAGLGLGFLFLGVRRWPLVAVCGAAAALAALAISFTIPDRWISTAVLRMDQGGDASRLVREVLSEASLSQIIRRRDLHLYEKEQTKTPIGELAARMWNHDVRIEFLGNAVSPRYGSAFVISVAADDRHKAQAVVRVLVTKIVEQNVVQASRQPTNLQVLDPASFPEQPVGPNRYAITLLGLAFGVLGGIVVVWRRPRALAAGV
jgi:uncharacterized protein involved in exopolysaccharide biosynthesis